MPNNRLYNYNTLFNLYKSQTKLLQVVYNFLLIHEHTNKLPHHASSNQPMKSLTRQLRLKLLTT